MRLTVIGFTGLGFAWALASVVGCAPTGEGAAPVEGADHAPVPVQGVVTLNGKPLGKAVVTFLPPSGPGVGVGETDPEGKFQLSSGGRAGVPPGDYKVAISYLVSADGEPQGLGARSSITQGPGMLSAKEQLPATYSDLGRTSLTAKVGVEGGRFDFDLEAAVPAQAEKPVAKDPAAAEPKSEGTDGPKDRKE